MNFMSIVIPTYKKPERLGLTLLGLSRQKYPLDQYEVVIINDACDENTDKLIEEFQRVPGFHVQGIHGEGKGPANAKNIGIPLARGNVLVFLDDDVLCPPYFLQNHSQFYQGDQSSNTVVTSKRKHLYIDLNQEKQQWIKEKMKMSFSDLLAAGYDDPHCSLLDKAYTASKPNCSAAWVCLNGCNFSASRDVLERVGYFDSHMSYLEDTDISLRMWEHGACFYYCREAENLHMEHEKNVGNRKAGWQKNFPIFRDKHGLTAELYAMFFNGEVSFDELNRCYTKQEYPIKRGLYGSYWFWEDFACRRWERVKN